MSNSDEKNVKKTNAEEDAKIEQKSAEVKEDTPVAEAQVSAEESKTEEVKEEEAPVAEAPAEEAKTEEAPVEEAKTEEAPAEEAKTEEAPAEEAKTEEAPAEEAKTEEAPAEEAKTEEAPAEEAPVEKKGFQARSTKPQRPTECASCGKAFVKKIWYYRNAAFYCNKKCYLTKTEADKQKAAEEAAKEAAKE
jgi:hypothetical protein